MSNSNIFFSGSTSTKAQSRPTSDSQGYARSNPGGHQTSLSLSMISPLKNPSNKDFCRICSCSFTLISKKLICKGCSEPMCYIHSSLLDRYNLERICDYCMQEILKKQAEDEIAEIKQQLIGELSFSTLEREEKTRLINKSLGRIRKLRIEKKDKEDKFKREKVGLEKSKKNHEDELKSVLNQVAEIKAMLEEQEESENEDRERCMMTICDEEGVMERVNFWEGKMNEVENKAEYLKGEVGKYMSLKAVQKIVCIGCNNVLAKEFCEEFKEIVTGKKVKGQEEISKQICACEIV